MTDPSVPSWAGVATSLVLVGFALGVVLRERLGLARDVVLATVRAAAQLVAVAAVLGVLFDRAGLPGAVGWVAGMVGAGTVVAGRRGRGLPKPFLTAAVAVTTGVVATLGLLVAARVVDAEARVVVPVGGMVVSAAVRGVTVVLVRVREEAERSRREVEARLALGLSGRAAFAPHARSALRTALVTDVDAVASVGLISLPGAMTGLLLAGVEPLTAIRYQVVVMYMLLGAVAVSGLVASRLATRLLFDEGERLREVGGT